MQRRPPTPPLFPYTTLFRSPERRRREARRWGGRLRTSTGPPAAFRSRPPPARSRDRPPSRRRRTAPSTGCRSEEHTSELQSHVNLVCRLLLEKKKNKRRCTF